MENNTCDIDELDMSDKWKRRFHLLRQFGADELSHAMMLKSDAFRQLSFKERWSYSIVFNIAAFIFGFMYYFYKRMHLKGAVILCFTLLWVAALAMIEFFTGVVIPNVVYWGPSSALCAQWANYDLYRKTFHNEQLWDWMPAKWCNKSSVLGFLALSVTIWGGTLYYEVTHTYSTYAGFDDPNAVRVPCGSYVMLVTQEEIDSHGQEVICAIE
ncbi:DUF2628 domain-containing protein [Vibrio neptunius]|uniref:DUF2628 domain-containing protein n=1 Tax=Vibrio neptunius TaxID=170651 RepID=A0ABS2ZWX4_9VIBR|nr:DUF2628 domain-containing protein [Vibrio neptunius]MBN3492199.1 DUF2628 domain-containing protein [Vibrio neptunius]MBN3514696.1 DUF2628 domain-containing protein [Vibrio neptunius]MBN3549178.1 DUF2628 domain-containing protein [Vibrio neptunius]MBN3576703.1 DUF2628 domain-containing protein [Vibrio neptunius]MCH9870367.1 DUF2628 domain-containing protein [Vibrio neptunius]